MIGTNSSSTTASSISDLHPTCLISKKLIIKYKFKQSDATGLAPAKGLKDVISFRHAGCSLLFSRCFIYTEAIIKLKPKSIIGESKIDKTTGCKYNLVIICMPGKCYRCSRAVEKIAVAMFRL